MGCNTSKPVPANVDTIPKLIQLWSETLPDRELFVFYNDKNRQSYTSRQILQLAGKFAGRLRREYGFQKGDIIANTIPNSPERLITDLGITLAGCICMSAELLYADGSDFLYTARNTGLVAVIVCPHTQSPAWKILEPYLTWDQASRTASLTYDRVPDMKQAILVSRRGWNFLQELKDSTEDIFVEPDIRSDDIMYAYTTSGTTGFCKLVPYTHAGIIDTWSDMENRIKEQSQQVWKNIVTYNDRSLGWVGGFPFGTYLSADTRVLLDTFDTQGLKGDFDVWDIICRERVDYAIIMPLDLSHILQKAGIDGVTNYKVKLLGCGGQPIRKEQFRSYFALAKEVTPLYGSTEVGFLSFGIIGGFILSLTVYFFS